MRAHGFQLFGHVDVVVEAVFGAVGVEDVAGVADGGFADGVGFKDGVEGDFHVFDGVEGVEDAEDVDALPGGFVDEALDDVVGVGAVADGVEARSSIWKQMLGMAWRSCWSRCQGSSWRKRRAVSKVAPPTFRG